MVGHGRRVRPAHVRQNHVAVGQLRDGPYLIDAGAYPLQPAEPLRGQEDAAGGTPEEDVGVDDLPHLRLLALGGNELHLREARP